jgi:hypothetical protein
VLSCAVLCCAGVPAGIYEVVWKAARWPERWYDQLVQIQDNVVLQAWAEPLTACSSSSSSSTRSVACRLSQAPSVLERELRGAAIGQQLRAAEELWRPAKADDPARLPPEWGLISGNGMPVTAEMCGAALTVG